MMDWADERTIPITEQQIPSVEQLLGAVVVHVLASELRKAEVGQRLIFAGMSPDVKQSFTISHLHRILEIVDDLPEARKMIGG